MYGRQVEARNVRPCVLAFGALLALAPACGECGKSPPVATVEASVVEVAVPAPQGMVAQAWIRGADALWARLQNGVSGAAGLLPAETGALLCAVTGLDAAVGPLVDGKGVAYVVVADAPGGHGGLAWAAAVPLKDAAKVASLLLPADAGAARYSARDEQGMRVLTRIDHPLGASMALAQGWLLVAHDDAALSGLAPYAWRTMPTLPAPSGTASVVAVLSPGALASRTSASWADTRAWLAAQDAEQRAKHGGRAADFGDPQAIVEAVDTVVQRRVALLSSAHGATLQLEAGDDDVYADLVLEPALGDVAPSGWSLVTAMTPGDARPLADVPSDAVLALLVRDGAQVRKDDAHDLEAALGKALAAHAHEGDDRAVATALDAWAAGRGDWLTASLAWSPSRAVSLRSPGGEAASKALRGLVDLASRPVFADPLRSLLGLGAPSVGAAHVEGLGAATLAGFGGKSPLGLAWGVGGETLFALAGEHADQRLALQLAGGHQGDDPRVARALSALGSDASVVVLAQPLRVDAARAGSDAARSPALFAWGRRDGKAWLHVDVGDELLREVVRLQAGL
jgi:hypothetical protein